MPTNSPTTSPTKSPTKSQNARRQNQDNMLRQNKKEPPTKSKRADDKVEYNNKKTSSCTKLRGSRDKLPNMRRQNPPTTLFCLTCLRPVSSQTHTFNLYKLSRSTCLTCLLGTPTPHFVVGPWGFVFAYIITKRNSNRLVNTREWYSNVPRCSPTLTRGHPMTESMASRR